MMGSLEAFYGAASGVAGALIGLLFVALSVVSERTAESGFMQSHKIRAGAALIAFTNALGVSLFSLIYGSGAGTSVLIFAVVGLGFVCLSTAAMFRERSSGSGKVGGWSSAIVSLVLLTVLAGAFAAQLAYAILLLKRPGSLSYDRNIATLVVVFFLIGILRAWELIGGPSVGLFGALLASLGKEQAEHSRPEEVADANETASHCLPSSQRAMNHRPS